MKSTYILWLTIAAVVVGGLVIIGLAPRWRHLDRVEQELEKMAAKMREREPSVEPGQGKVSRNVERALRFDMPVVAFYYVPPPDHDHGHEHEEMTEEQREQLERARMVLNVQRMMLQRLAAAYKDAVAVVEVTPEAAPASFERHKVNPAMPTMVIYSADNQEVWRHEGFATDEELSHRLADLDVKPTAPLATGPIATEEHPGHDH